MKKERLPIFTNRQWMTFDVGDGSVMYFLPSANETEYKTCLLSIEGKGYGCNEMREVAGNSFASFVQGEKYIYVYFLSAVEELRVVYGPLHTFCSLPQSMEKEEVQPKLCLVGQIEVCSGLGTIYVLPNGKLLVQDGGEAYPEKGDYVYQAMKRIAPTPHKIVVAAWFLSHPHNDHQDAFSAFVKAHNKDSDLTIENVIYNYLPTEKYGYIRLDGMRENDTDRVKFLREEAPRLLPNTKFCKGHTGQVFHFGSASVEILYTVEDFLPQEREYTNSDSMVLKVCVAGQSAMLLADTTHESGFKLEDIWGKTLKADMVQLAHHGLYASNPSLYQTINADVLLWGSTKYFAEIWKKDKGTAAAIDTVKDIFIAGTDIVVVPLPHTVENNKEKVFL